MNHLIDKNTSVKKISPVERLKNFGLKNEVADVKSIDETIKKHFSSAEPNRLTESALGIVERLKNFGLSKY